MGKIIITSPSRSSIELAEQIAKFIYEPANLGATGSEKEYGKDDIIVRAVKDDSRTDDN